MIDSGASSAPGRTVVFATLGTLGDLYPFIAIALALRDHGYHPLLAVAQDHLEVCAQAGLDAVAIHPGFAAVRDRMGLDHSQAVRRVVGNQRVMLETVLLADLPACAAALDAACGDAVAIVGSIFVFAAAMVAEKRRLPLISVVLQPMAMLSESDPPQTPDFWMMWHASAGPVARRWNRTAYAGLRRIVDVRYGRRIDAVRGALGLPGEGAAYLLESADRAILRIGCYSAVLGVPADLKQPTRIVGFPMFDGTLAAATPLSASLAAFLAAGPAPLVFTLGSFVVGGAAAFYDDAAAIARRLGMRAVLLTGAGTAESDEGGIFRCAYAPHSRLFPAAAVIIHHGGIGTTGQALRVGKPQLVVPHMGDQHDHGHRLERLGVGRMLTGKRFTVRRATALIRTLLADPGYAGRAAQIAQTMAPEHGAAAAADAIADALAERDAAAHR